MSLFIRRDSFDQSDLFNGSETHRNQVFSGVYASTTAVNPLTMDFYALLLDEDNPTLVVPGVTSPARALISSPSARELKAIQRN